MSSPSRPPTSADPTIDDLWRVARPRLVDLGYRMLGSVAEATDAADEAFARLVAADRSTIDDPTGWLVRVASRICLDRLRSADLRRRAYVGPWLPEPIVGSVPSVGGENVDPDPADRVTLDETVRLALLVVLDRLTPAERVALVLHDFFGLPFDEVAQAVGRSPVACRQLASRARRKVRSDPEVPAAVDHGELERVARRFAAACATGTVEALVEVLAPDAVGDFDSGGMLPGAPLRPLVGAESIARLLVNVFRSRPVTFGVETVNGEPGLVIRSSGHLVAAAALVVAEGRVVAIHGIGNPDKLGRRPPSGPSVADAAPGEPPASSVGEGHPS